VWVAFGVPEDFMKVLEDLELRTARGTEEGYFRDNIDKIVGKTTVKDYIEQNKDVWNSTQ
jgi:hypothetical protein